MDAVSTQIPLLAPAQVDYIFRQKCSVNGVNERTRTLCSSHSSIKLNFYFEPSARAVVTGQRNHFIKFISYYHILWLLSCFRVSTCLIN